MTLEISKTKFGNYMLVLEDTMLFIPPEKYGENHGTSLWLGKLHLVFDAKIKVYS